MKRIILPSLAFLILSACTTTRVERYQSLLEPLVGNARRSIVDEKLGNPTLCEKKNGMEYCEYQTAVERNEPVPDGYRATPGFNINPKPYEYFDVLGLSFDSTGVLVDWKPIVIK